MLKNIKLNQLSTSSLLNLQKHIELGRNHLQSVITQEGIEQLCSLESSNLHVEQKMQVTHMDFADTFAKYVNNTLMTVIGAWIGFNQIAGIVLTSKPLFQIVVLCSFAIGITIGMQNYRVVKREIQKQQENRKLQDIQLDILYFLSEKRKLEITDKTEEIYKILQKMGVRAEKKRSVPDTYPFLQELEKLESTIQKRYGKSDPNVNRLFADAFDAIKRIIQRDAELSSSQKENIPPILQTLIETPISKKSEKKIWIKNNWKYLITSSIPVLYGTFISWYNTPGDAKIVAQQVKWMELYFLLSNPTAQKFVFVFAIAATLYFTFSFININRRKFIRDQEIDKATKQIVKNQDTLSKLDDHSLKIKEMLFYMQKIYGIYAEIKKGGRKWTYING